MMKRLRVAAGMSAQTRIVRGTVAALVALLTIASAAVGHECDRSGGV
jgi:hypothetical protein